MKLYTCLFTNEQRIATMIRNSIRGGAQWRKQKLGYKDCGGFVIDVPGYRTRDFY